MLRLVRMMHTYFNKNLLEAGVDEAGRGPLGGRVYTASAVIPKYLTSAHAAPFLLFGPLKFVMKPVLEASSGDVGSLLIVGGAESLNPASSSIINGDQIIIGVFPAK